MSPEIEQLLRKIAEKSVCTYDDVDMDWNGQDSFLSGERAGRTEFARELCEKLGIVFKMPIDDED